MECFHLPHCHARTYPWTCPSVRPALLPSIPLFMALRVKAKVKVGTRVSNFRFQRQLHRLLGGICSVGFSVSGSFGFFGQGVQTLSTKQTVVNFWWRKYFFPFRLFSLQEAHLAALLLTSIPFFCQMLMVVVALLPRPPTSTRPLRLQLQQLYWIWPDIGKVSSQATRWQRAKVFRLAAKVASGGSSAAKHRIKTWPKSLS